MALRSIANEPPRLEAMHRAYDMACASLGLSPVPDRINELLVTKIVELSATERDADRLCEEALAYYRRSGARSAFVARTALLPSSPFCSASTAFHCSANRKRSPLSDFAYRDVLRALFA
jgi:hypothetical protein